MGDSGLESPVSEAELHGFIDGGLSRGRYAAVQAFLAASPADAARVQTWQRQNETIRAAFAVMKSPSPPLSFASDPGAGRGALMGRNGWHGNTARSWHGWRERWSPRLTAAAFTSGVLLAGGADYVTNHMSAPDNSERASVAAAANETIAARTIVALKAYNPSPAAAPPAKGDENEPDLAVPVLPALPLKGLKLTGVRAMPGEQGHLLCLFYVKPDNSKLGLCAEKTPGPSEALPQFSGSTPTASISWRQNGATYALAGALPEPDLRALAEAVRAEVAAFGTK